MRKLIQPTIMLSLICLMFVTGMAQFVQVDSFVHGPAFKNYSHPVNDLDGGQGRVRSHHLTIIKIIRVTPSVNSKASVVVIPQRLNTNLPIVDICNCKQEDFPYILFRPPIAS